MFKKLMTMTLVLGLARSAAGADPIGSSVAKSAQTPAGSTRNPRPNKALIWTGIAMMGVGAGLAGASAALGQHTCLYTPFGSCVEQSEANMGALWGGLGLAGVGAFVTIRGAKPRAEITVLRGGFLLSKTIRFESPINRNGKI